MEIATTRTYYFTEEEMRIIYAFCQIANSIGISERMDYDNDSYSPDNLFYKKYAEFLDTGKCSSSFRVSDQVTHTIQTS